MTADRCLDDAEGARRRRAANLKRRLHMIRLHASRCDPLTGKSTIAQKGGRAAAAKRIAHTMGGAQALGLELALARWYPEESGDG